MEIILVNKQHPLPEDYIAKDLIELKDIPGRCFDLKQDALLNKTVAEALVTFLTAAQNAGFSGMFIGSAYRTREDQERLCREYSDELAAEPGQSEHETGLAVDIAMPAGKTVPIFFKWMQDNCQNYGFILRYPEDKEDITGFRYEPWHFRYVGVEVAEFMKNHDLCLEEYFKEKYDIPFVRTDIYKKRRMLEKLIWDFLMEKLDNPYGAAGLMGNLYAESSLIPNILQYDYQSILGLNSKEYTEAVDNGEYKNFVDDCAGYGLAQWTFSTRKQGLLSFAKEAKKSIGDPLIQLVVKVEKLKDKKISSMLTVSEKLQMQ